jgi:hypothetical protein
MTWAVAMDKRFIVLITVGALFAAAWMFRYAPIGEMSGGALVWDRWLQRTCVIGVSHGNRLLCDMQSIQDAQNKR